MAAAIIRWKCLPDGRERERERETNSCTSRETGCSRVRWPLNAVSDGKRECLCTFLEGKGEWEEIEIKVRKKKAKERRV